jgi:Zn-finger nucleic acid-binding protein
MPYRDGDLRCPHCPDAALTAQTVQWIERHACRTCSGVWFDRARLDELAGDLRIPTDAWGEPGDTPSSRPCPRCLAPMTARTVCHDDAAIAIDTCPAHGVWFDHEELEPTLDILMARADLEKSPFERTNRPWWAATLSFVMAALGAQRKHLGQR